MKKCISVILALFLVVGVLPTIAFAAPKEIVPPEIEEDVVASHLPDLIDQDVSEIQASGAPKKHWNLTNVYTATLKDLAATRSSYTMYYFSTASGIINLNCDMMRSGTTDPMGRAMKVELYEKDTASATGRLFLTRWVYFARDETRTVLFAGLDPNRFYYIKFCNESGASASSKRDISGTIKISGTYKR